MRHDATSRKNELGDPSATEARAATRRLGFIWAPPALPGPAYIPIALALVAVTAATLWTLGRPVVCACADLRVWGVDATGPENSQHLIDWYSALHVVFGMMCFGLLWLTSRSWPAGWLYIVAIVASSAWEITENTPFMIAAFGDSGVGALYRGDSIPNSLMDTAFVLAGFAVATKLPAAATITLGLGIEAAVAFSIHDSLTIGLFNLAAHFDGSRLS